MKKTKDVVDIILTAIIIFMLIGFNVLVGFGSFWELFLSPKEPQWVPMTASILATLFFDLVFVSLELDHRIHGY